MAADRGFVQRAVLAAVAEDSATDRAAQVARGQHVCRRVVGVVAVAFFLVAQADFQAVLVALGAQQAHLDPGALDQRVEGHGGAVDAQVTVGDQFGRLRPVASAICARPARMARVPSCGVEGP
jgi:hypothetical protein